MSGSTPRSRRPKTVPLDFFARDSKASGILANLLNISGDAKLISKLARHFNQYITGLNDIMPCQNSTQGILFEMWCDRFIKSGREIFEEKFREHGIEYDYYVNILKTRLARARELGGIWQKMV
jgi:hypothetical protein